MFMEFMTQPTQPIKRQSVIEDIPNDLHRPDAKAMA
jgi:hypothetical protein